MCADLLNGEHIAKHASVVNLAGSISLHSAFSSLCKESISFLCLRYIVISFEIPQTQILA